MRRLRVFLMLCTAAASGTVHACDAVPDPEPVTAVAPARPNVQPTVQPTVQQNVQPSAQPGRAPRAQTVHPCSPAAPQTAATLKVSDRPNAPPSPGKEAANARDRHDQAGPVLVSALVMLIIALRRGGR